MPIKAKFFRVCSNVFWYMGLIIPSLKAYIASVLEVRNTRVDTRVETACVVYSHTCESGCTGNEVCIEAPARSIHDYEVLYTLHLIIHMKRVKVQTALLLLEMTKNEFTNWIKDDFKAIKPRIVYKILDSIDGISSDIIDEFRDAYEIWIERGSSIYDIREYFSDVLDKLSDAQLDEFFEKFNSSPELSDRVDPKLQKQIFDEIIKRTKQITPDIARDLIDSIDDIVKTSGEDVYFRHLRNFFISLISDLLHEKGTSPYDPRKEWLNLVREVSKSVDSSSKASKTYENLLIDTEQALNNLTKLVADIKNWSIQSDLNKIFDLVKNSPGDMSFVTLLTSRIKDPDTRKLIFNAFLTTPRSFATMYTDSCGSRSKSQYFVKVLSRAIERTVKNLKKIESFTLNEYEKRRFLCIVNIARKLTLLDRNKFDDVAIWRLGGTVSEFIEAEDTNDITDFYIESLENAFKIGLVTGESDSGLKSLESLERQVDEAVSRETVLKDPLFQETVSSLQQLALSTNAANINLSEIRSAFEDIGPKHGVDGWHQQWGGIIIQMVDGTANSDPKYYKDNLVKAWLMTSEADRSNLVQRVEQLLEPYIEAANIRNAELKKKNPPEAAEDDVLNQYAFAEKRPGLPIEPDNKRERELYKALKRHFRDNNPIDPELANEISKILANDQYDSIFKKPTQEYVYRGMSVSAKWLISALKIDNPHDFKQSGSKEASFTFTPKDNREVTSWSVDHEKAMYFAHNYDEPGSYSIFLVAKTSENPNKFVLGPDGLYKVPGLDSHTGEKEAIGIGPIKVMKIYWASNNIKLNQLFLHTFDDMYTKNKKSDIPKSTGTSKKLPNYPKWPRQKKPAQKGLKPKKGDKNYVSSPKAGTGPIKKPFSKK